MGMMDEPAFPQNPSRFFGTGLTKREYFAAMALTAMIHKSGDADGGWDSVSVAVGCVAMADALLAALADPTPPHARSEQ